MEAIRRCILLIVCLLNGVLCLWAQEIEFNELNWDFGTIEEMGGKVSHTFEFKNIGKSPVVIVNVRATCGCTTSEFSREPVAVGAHSKLEVTFDPRYRPGIFRKSIYVHSSVSREPFRLSIMGRVTPRVLSLEERYPFVLTQGGRLGEMYLMVRGVSVGAMMQTSVEYYNEGRRDMKIEFRPRHESKHLKLFYGEKVAAESGGTMDVGYFVEEGDDVDVMLCDTLDIYINGRASGKSLYVNGNWAK